MQADLFDQIAWNEDGLLPAIAQDVRSGKVLMMAWMNREALAATIREHYAVYWSRSRKALWRKGETSGNLQKIHRIRLDCDGDTLLLQVEQVGGIACHTGRESCFFLELSGSEWQSIEPVLKNPKEMYS